MNPTASAPSSTANCASGRFVMPQILIFVSKQLSNLRTDVLTAHQRLADEDCIGACRGHALDIRAGVDAALGDQNAFRARTASYSGREFLRGRKAHRKITQIAVVDADEPGPGRQRAIQFKFVVDLDERVQPELVGEPN